MFGLEYVLSTGHDTEINVERSRGEMGRCYTCAALCVAAEAQWFRLQYLALKYAYHCIHDKKTRYLWNI